MANPALSTPPIRVLIADDQAMVRTGFRFFLDARPDITVVTEAVDGEEAVALARRLRPDVCLLDIRCRGWTVRRRPGCRPDPTWPTRCGSSWSPPSTWTSTCTGRCAAETAVSS